MKQMLILLCDVYHKSSIRVGLGRMDVVYLLSQMEKTTYTV